MYKSGILGLLEQSRPDLKESMKCAMRKRNVKRVKRENGKLRNKLKEVEILQDNNDELIKHIQELESIVDKV